MTRAQLNLTTITSHYLCTCIIVSCDIRITIPNKMGAEVLATGSRLNVSKLEVGHLFSPGSSSFCSVEYTVYVTRLPETR